MAITQKNPKAPVKAPMAQDDAMAPFIGGTRMGKGQNGDASKVSNGAARIKPNQRN